MSKKLLALLLALVMLLGTVPGALAAAEDINVYVSVVKDGAFVTGKDGTTMAAAKVTVPEGATIGDAFEALHEQYYEGNDGYVTADTAWGESVTTFWGTESASVGYYHNNASAYGLDVTVAAGDDLTFFFYQDTANWSDQYTYFDPSYVAVREDDCVRLELIASTWEGSAPLAGAPIVWDGEVMDFTTDTLGRAELIFDEAGTHFISAAAPEGSCIVPPICVVQVEEQTAGEKTVRAELEELMGNIAASYVDNATDWVIQTMAVYDYMMGFSGYTTSHKAALEYIDSAIATLKGEDLTDSAIARTILTLTALDVDVTELYTAAGERINAVELLSGVEHSASAWAAPYTLAAYNQGEWGTDAYETALVDAILAAQGEDGSWSEWGDSVQTTAHMLMGLFFYAGDERVDAAVEKAVEYLSAAQAEDGTYDAYGYGPDANTAAMVVMGLVAAGVDPDRDARFIKGGVSAFDFLMSFAYDDLTGFGYQNNVKGGEAESSTAYATQQAFLATLMAYGIRTMPGVAECAYDFRGGETWPAYESASVHPDVKKAEVTQPEATFPDIAGHAHQTAIEALAQRTIITGKGDGSYYDPDTTMTRAEFAAIVVRALGLTPAATDAFTDVPAEAWFAPYVGTAHAYGIVNGTNDGTTFTPDGTITRQEAACMVARAAALCGKNVAMDEGYATIVLAQFGDYTTVADWAKNSVAFCYDADILDQSALDIRPTEFILRHEIASMLYNLLNAAELL